MLSFLEDLGAFCLGEMLATACTSEKIIKLLEA